MHLTENGEAFVRNSIALEQAGRWLQQEPFSV